MFWNSCFVFFVFLECIFLNLCEPFAFMNFSLVFVTFKKSKYFTCVTAYRPKSMLSVFYLCGISKEYALEY